MPKWMKPLGFLAVLILICSVTARVITGRSETLAEYADKNPPSVSASPSHSPSTASESLAASGSTPSPEALSPPEMTAASPSLADRTDRPNPQSAPTPPNGPSSEFTPLCPESGESTHYQDGFFYQPLTDPVIARITGISYPVSKTIAPALARPAVNLISDQETPAVSYEDLRYMNVLHYNFDGEVQTGELICNKEIADDLIEIFYELYQNEYQIEKIRLIDEYNGDDTASMEDNNTSCFNYRMVDGTSNLSKHALGCAIDINPFYNPYLVFDRNGSGETYISPAGSEAYADRSLNFPYKIDENDLCYRLFTEHGFTWGGNWNSSKDYQHFQKTLE